MRTISLTADEANLVYLTLDQAPPQRGLSVSDIRKVLPLMDKLEAPAKHIPVPGGERLEFVDMELQLKESEYQLVLSKFEESAGWSNANIGRRVIRLIDRLKEIPATGEQS